MSVFVISFELFAFVIRSIAGFGVPLLALVKVLEVEENQDYATEQHEAHHGRDNAGHLKNTQQGNQVKKDSSAASIKCKKQIS